MEVAKKLQQEEDSYLLAKKLQEEEDSYFQNQTKKIDKNSKLKTIPKPSTKGGQTLIYDDLSELTTYYDEDFEGYDGEDYDEEEDGFYENYEEKNTDGGSTVTTGQSLKKFQPATNKMMKHSGKIQLEGKSIQVHQQVKSELDKINYKNETSKVRYKDKEDR